MVKVDVPGNELQWIAQGLDLAFARCLSEEVKLDGAAGWGFAHRVIVALAGLASVGNRQFLEVSFSRQGVMGCPLLLGKQGIINGN